VNITERSGYFSAQLAKLRAICGEAKVEMPSAESFERLLSKQTFDIAFVGEFSSGKTTIVNAFIGEDLLPTKLEPTTARITYISYGDAPAIYLCHKDGRHEAVEYSKSLIKNLIASNTEAVADIESIDLLYPSPALKGGIRFIDTPGTNDPDMQRVAITYRLLPEVDAVVYVTGYPITESNLTSYETHIFKNSIGAVFYALNRVDLLGDQRDDAVRDCRNYFEERTGGSIQLYPMSARDYLDGVLDDDTQLKAASGYPVFAQDLIRFIEGNDRFAAMETHFRHHLDVLKAQAVELLNLRVAGLSLSEEEYGTRKTQLKEQLKKAETDGKALEEDIDGEFDRLTARLSESVDKLFQEILESLDMELDSPSGGNSQLLLRQIEMGVRNRFEGWRMRNEPIIHEYISTLQGEIQVRLGQVSRQVDTSLAVFAYKPNAAVQTNSQASLDPVSQILSDPEKAQKIIPLAATGTYVALALFHVAAAPLALIIAPLGYFWMSKRREAQRVQMKAQLMGDLRQKRYEFRDEVLKGIEAIREQMLNDVDEHITRFGHSVREQLEDVDRERDTRKLDLERTAIELRGLISKAEAL
jgi:hypothetical protein